MGCLVGATVSVSGCRSTLVCKPSEGGFSIIIFTDAWSQKGLVNAAVDHAERELKKVVFVVPNHTDTPTAENSNIHLNL